MQKNIFFSCVCHFFCVPLQPNICLTDMLKAKGGDFFVTDWLRNRNTLEYIGNWEKANKPHVFRIYA